MKHLDQLERLEKSAYEAAGNDIGGEHQMPIDLDKLSVQELKNLQKEIPKAIKRVAERRKQEARAELEARAKELGFSLPELLGAGRKGKSADAKFAHPDDPSITWSGRGRKPKWFSDAVAGGKKAKELAI